MQQATRLPTAQCGGSSATACAPGAGLAVVAGGSVLSRPRAQPPSEAGGHTAVRAACAARLLLLPAAAALRDCLIRLLLPLPSCAPAQHLRRQPRARALPARSLAAVRLHTFARSWGGPCCVGPGLRGGAKVGALAGARLRVVGRCAVLGVRRCTLLARLPTSVQVISSGRGWVTRNVGHLLACLPLDPPATNL